MVTNWETHICNVFHHFIFENLWQLWHMKLCYYRLCTRGEGHFDVCVCIQIHHGQILIVISENVGKHFLQCLRNCKPLAQHAAASSSTAGEGETQRGREGANYSGLVKIIKLNNGNASYYVNNNRGTFVVERNCFIKAAVTHAGNFANISRPWPWLHMAYCMR